MSELDDIQIEEKIIDGKKYTINIYKDLLDLQTIRIAIQVYQYRFLGMGYMQAEGFALDKNETITDLRMDEIYAVT